MEESAATNSIGVQGSRQIASLDYNICIKTQAGKCSITYKRVRYVEVERSFSLFIQIIFQPVSDPYAFTLTDDVKSVDIGLLGTSVLQSLTCTTDFISIPSPSQIIRGVRVPLGNNLFCGLGIGDIYCESCLCTEVRLRILTFSFYFSTCTAVHGAIGYRCQWNSWYCQSRLLFDLQSRHLHLTRENCSMHFRNKKWKFMCWQKKYFFSVNEAPSEQLLTQETGEVLWLGRPLKLTTKSTHTGQTDIYSTLGYFCVLCFLWICVDLFSFSQQVRNFEKFI